jgi:hypothetical protein
MKCDPFSPATPGAEGIALRADAPPLSKAPWSLGTGSAFGRLRLHSGHVGR